MIVLFNYCTAFTAADMPPHGALFWC